MKKWIITLLSLGFGICLFAGAPAQDARDPAGRSPSPFSPAAETAVETGAPAEVPATPKMTAEKPLLRIAHPAEGARLPALSSTFVFGSAPADGTLTINGAAVPIHPGGGFLAMVELSTGPFLINAELSAGGTTYTYTRTVFVDPPASASPLVPLTIEYVTPEAGMELSAGDKVVVSCKGSPGASASFTVSGIKKSFPMVETDIAPGGIYRGMYLVNARDPLKNSTIKVTLADRKGRKRSKIAEGLLTYVGDETPLAAEVTAENAVLRAGPSLYPGEKAGYLIFPPKGTVLAVTGRRGEEFRVRLNAAKEGWISRSEIRFLPEGTPLASTVAGTISVAGTKRTTDLRLTLGRRIPFEVLPDASGAFVDVVFYGASSNTDWINYAGISAGAVEQAKWFQDDAETYRLRLFTPRPWWGYDARYEGTTFVLELRCPPPLAKGQRPLDGIAVCVDPGHSADTGAIGPTGLVEKDANLAIARHLRRKLINRGARVIMTREGDENVPLYERPRIAARAGADIFVSVHNNALPDGKNPLEKNGYGVYYFHPLSFPLAREIHAAYGALVGREGTAPYRLRDDGLYYGNLAIPRTPQMPSVLTESAYVILPSEEAYLKTDEFPAACAESIVRGIERYVARMRPASGVPRRDADASAVADLPKTGRRR